MRGLRNLGCTCYLNATLQCLAHVPPLTNFLTTHAPRCEGDDRLAELARAYATFVRDYWCAADRADCAADRADPSKTPVDPSGVWRALCAAHPHFARKRPHDAHEALVFLLGALETIRLPDSSTLVSHVFESEIRSVAESGTYTNATIERPAALSLDVCGSLEQGLHAFQQRESPDGFVVAGEAGEATVTRTIERAAFVVVVHLKRFRNDGSKIDRFVDYSTTLDVAGNAYDLFGVCFHKGCAANGHYVAACEVGGKWFAMDDEVASEILDINSVVHRDAYMLFFKKRLEVH